MLGLRNDGRAYDEIRPCKITFDVFSHADASVLFESGNTKILAAVTLQDRVPLFLKGKGNGWLTAEYAMLPTATKERANRESRQVQPNSRSLEISRLIGRSLRSVVDLSSIGERTIVIDCDVLQADGGTRCASVSAASIALKIAVDRWLHEGIIKKNIILDSIAAISVGIIDGHACLDLSQEEDCRAEVDFNFVLSKSGNIIEIQGTSEKAPMSWENFAALKQLALQGVEQIFQVRKHVSSPKHKKIERDNKHVRVSRDSKKALFSLGNRL